MPLVETTVVRDISSALLKTARGTIALVFDFFLHELLLTNWLSSLPLIHGTFAVYLDRFISVVLIISVG